MSDETHFVEVYSAANVLNAHTVQSALLEAGIEAVVDGEPLQNAMGGLQGETAPRVLVHESQAEAARALIARVESAQFHAESDGADDSACLRCGKPLAPNEETCAACGWSFRQSNGVEAAPAG